MIDNKKGESFTFATTMSRLGILSEKKNVLKTEHTKSARLKF